MKAGAKPNRSLVSSVSQIQSSFILISKMILNDLAPCLYWVQLCLAQHEVISREPAQLSQSISQDYDIHLVLHSRKYHQQFHQNILLCHYHHVQ